MGDAARSALRNLLSPPQLADGRTRVRCQSTSAVTSGASASPRPACWSASTGQLASDLRAELSGTLTMCPRPKPHNRTGP